MRFTALHSFLRSRCRVAVAIAVLVLSSVPARAGLTISVTSTAETPGSSNNSVEVLLTNTGLEAVNVAAFSFELGSSTGEILFTEANTDSLDVPYIFVNSSLFGPLISTNSGPVLDASDLFDAVGGFSTIGAGATVELGHVLFNVGSSASLAQVTLTLAGVPATGLSGPGSAGSSSDIPVANYISGTVSVSSAVSEPGPLALVPVGGIVVAWVTLRRDARAS